ncbi:MAG: T9SS type A sorting domain-containing protein [Candidatus Cloacimonetes bacterium]|nr:T9SS type A sorting domain-containing protein [Candidatus Cloacimonadota bacterium]
MKHIIIFLVIFIILSTLCYAQEPQGYIEYKEDKTIVRVWGTHYERGYAQGYLLCNGIIDIFSTYFLGYIFGNNAAIYNNTRSIFVTSFSVDALYQTEGEGLLDGIVAAGQSLYNNVLGRDIDVTDLMMCNSIVDYTDENNLFSCNDLCSSLASWGSSTSSSPELLGESIITRFLDWTPHQALMENHLLLVSFPSEPDEQNWISFTFPGLIGCLSAVNEGKVGSFYNVGNIDSYDPTDTFNPIFLSIRNGIESADYDGNGQCNPMDVVKAVSDDVQRSGSIMNVISPTEKDSFSLVIECNNMNGVMVRNKDDNTLIAGDNLAATNHFRKLYAPVYCYRYDHIADSLDMTTVINPTRSWDLLSGAAGTSTNIQAIQYIPSTGAILWSTKTGSYPAYKEAPTSFTTDELFDYVGIDDPNTPHADYLTIHEISPNPVFDNVTIRFFCRYDSNIDLSIYDVKGRLMQRNAHHVVQGENEILLNFDKHVTSGFYFVKLGSNGDTELRKILVVR